MKSASRLSILFLLALAFTFGACQNPQLTLKPFAVNTNDGKVLAELATDGTVKMMGEVAGTLTKDGVLKATDGKVIAILHNDGMVKSGEGEKLFAVDANGQISNVSGKTYSWDKDGRMTFSKEQYITLDANEKELRKTASLLFGVYASFGASSNRQSEGTMPQ